MKLRHRLKNLLKTVPGKVAAASVTAVVGAAVAYFAPGFLDSLTGNDALRLQVKTNPTDIGDLGQEVLVRDARSAVGSPGSGCTGFHAWAERVGGVQVGRTYLRVVAQGGSQRIYITDVRVHVVSRRRPFAGTSFDCPTAGGVPVRDIFINLDDPGSTIRGRYIVGEKEHEISFEVGPGETEVFDVVAETRRCDCRWVLELVTIQNGEEAVRTVSDHGGSFHTTALPSGEPNVFYEWDWFHKWMVRSRVGYGVRGEYPAGTEAPPELTR